MITYSKLFEILERRDMKKTDLLNVVSSGTLAKLNKNQNLQTDVIHKICEYLRVQPGEIIDYYKITEISLITKESDLHLYQAGYRQKIIINYPTESEELTGIENMEIMASKRIYENTEDIESGKMKIPKTFIPEHTIWMKDPYYKNILN